MRLNAAMRHYAMSFLFCYLWRNQSLFCLFSLSLSTIIYASRTLMPYTGSFYRPSSFILLLEGYTSLLLYYLHFSTLSYYGTFTPIYYTYSTVRSTTGWTTTQYISFSFPLYSFLTMSYANTFDYFTNLRSRISKLRMCYVPIYLNLLNFSFNDVYILYLVHTSFLLLLHVTYYFYRYFRTLSLYLLIIIDAYSTFLPNV